MPGNIGLPEIAIVLVIALIVFGPKRLPELGKSLGSGLREFKASITGDRDDDDEHPQIENGVEEAVTEDDDAAPATDEEPAPVAAGSADAEAQTTPSGETAT